MNREITKIVKMRKTDAVQVIESSKINDLPETCIVQTNDLSDINAVQDSLNVDFAQRMKAKYLSVSQMLAHPAKNAQTEKESSRNKHCKVV